MNLLALQRDFRAWLTTESAEAAARLGAPSGLAVYLNTYRAQLLACLAETYATVRAWIGDTAFEAAAATHIDRVPPSSWTLDAYARDFPETLAGLYPEDAEVAELALLDRGVSDCFVGPNSPVVSIDTIGDIDWEQAVLHLVPTFATLPVTTNAAAIWSAFNAGAEPPPAEQLGRPATIAIWRNGFLSALRELDPSEAEAQSRASEGATFGELCALAIERHGEQDGTAKAGAWLGQWLRDGIVGAIDVKSAALR